jgi:hypothetical protein
MVGAPGFRVGPMQVSVDSLGWLIGNNIGTSDRAESDTDAGILGAGLIRCSGVAAAI